MQRAVCLCLVLASAPAVAGELDVDLGLQATTTGWASDHGGGPALGVRWFFTKLVGISFVGKEHYATIDDRFLSYFSVNADVHRDAGRVRLASAFGLVHQHEESRAAIMEQPLQAAFGVGDGIRHRLGARAAASLALPVGHHSRGDYYVALTIDGTLFADADRGPRWMASAGLSLGFTRR